MNRKELEQLDNLRKEITKLEPGIYIVEPVGQYFNRIDCEYIADKARVIEQV